MSGATTPHPYPTLLSGGAPDLGHQITDNPDLVLRSATHYAALTTDPALRTPEQQVMADQLGNALQDLPVRAPYEQTLYDLWVGQNEDTITPSQSAPP